MWGTHSTPSFADLDGDGDLDAVVGDFTGALRYFENTGSASAPAFTARTGAANPFDGVDVGSFSTPSFADFDGDGELDAVVGAFNGSLRYFLNTTPPAPDFAEQTGAANPFNTVDVGAFSAPSFADLDGDGDLDAVIGEYDGDLNYFENTGSAIAPAFTARIGAANPFDGVDVGIDSTPSFADLDGDGDLDALVGESNGTLNYFENTGSATAPAFTERTGAANPFNGVDLGSLSTPSFADLDGDGDFDAVVGEDDGTLHYFENTGTAIAAAFTERAGAANPLNGVNVGFVSTPSFADLDGDGDLDAVVGEFDGHLLYFENTGSATAPAFTARTGAANPFNGVDVGNFSTPSFADLDGDGDLDAVVGENTGPLHYFRNTGAGFTLVVDVTAQNDAAVLSADVRNLTETNAAAAISASGTLTISDADSPATFVAQAGTLGSYGTFAIDSAGAWAYTASSAHDAFVAGTTYTGTFQVASADGTPTSVTINIAGTNDAAVLSTDVRDLSETNVALATSGTLTISDPDSATTFVAQPGTAGSYGTFAIDSAGAWTYTASSAHDAFVAGTTYTDTFQVASADGTPTSVTINIAGTNDAAVLSADVRNLTETNAAVDISASGTLTISDVDSPATFVVQAGTAGSYGTFAINSAGAWTYTASSAHNEFVAGTTYTDTFQVASADGTPTSVTINILGSNDAAVSADDVYDGGSNNDTAVYSSATSPITIDLNAINRSGQSTLGGTTIGALLTGAGLAANTAVGYAEGVDIGTDALIGVENVVGGAGNDTIIGDNDANVITGGAGADAISGGGGNDIYYVDNSADTANENPNEGTDAVVASVNFVIPTNVEILYANGSGLTGTGSGNDDILISLGGSNTLIGLGGNDSYRVDSANDVVTETAGGGYDIVVATADYILPADVEALYLKGTGLTGTGSGGADTLLSARSGGANTLVGLGGDDLYYASHTGDAVTETASGGLDTVVATADYTLPANVEALYMNGSGLTGTGSGGADTLLSIGGANTLVGLGGNDLYYASHTGDSVIETASGGYDTVVATADYTMPADVEALYLIGTGLTGTGSAGADTLLSAASGGANTLVGLGGNDLYYVSHTGESVTETAGGGYDTVVATVDYVLPANVEALYMIGTGLTGTGSGGADMLLSVSGANTLVGLGGDDLYYVNHSGDSVIETAGGGYDTVAATADYTLPANVEALYLIGTGLTGTGSAGADTLLSAAGGGANTLVGLGGDDLYYVSHSGDSVTETAGGGYDTVVATVNYTVPANVEALYLVGTGLTGTGSAGADTLVTLGANTLAGAGGNDTFVFVSGQADGAAVADFDGQGAGQGDTLIFSGFGTAAQDATFTSLGGNTWQIHSGLDAHDEIITLSSGASIHVTDFLFV